MSAQLVLEADALGNLSVHSDFPCYIQAGSSCRSPEGSAQLRKLTGLPEVRVNVDHLSQSRADAYHAESPFLHSDHGFISTFLEKGWLHAFSSILQRLNQPGVSQGVDGENPGFVGKALYYIKQAVVSVTSRISQAPLGDAAIIENHAKALKWSDALIRALAWHPHATKLAVAFSDNAVRVYSTPSSSVVPLLKHKLQKGITDLAWMPYSASTLAVACTNGVFLWQVDPSSLSSRPSPSSVQFLSRPGHQPITSIAWAPDGSGILLTASACDPSVVAWEVSTERSEVLQRKGGKGNCLLLWAPDGSKVLCTTLGPLIRVWDTRTWMCEKWTSLTGKCCFEVLVTAQFGGANFPAYDPGYILCAGLPMPLIGWMAEAITKRSQAACWTSKGTDTLLFSTQDAPIIFSICFAYSPLVNDGLCGSEAAAVVMDLRDIDLPAPVSERLVGCQFGIHYMAWDCNEGYMAALLTGEDCQGDIVIFRSRTSSAIELTVCGFILGCRKCYAQSINLDKQTSTGAILTIGWSSGHVGYVPISAFSSALARDTVFVTGQQGASKTPPLLFSL